MAKGFLCSTSWNMDCHLGTVSWNVFSIKWALIWVIAKLCTVFQTGVITKTKQLIGKIQWILWRSLLFQLLFLATRSTKESSFDWFKLHSPLFKSQQPDRQEWIRQNYANRACILLFWQWFETCVSQLYFKCVGMSSHPVLVQEHKELFPTWR